MQQVSNAPSGSLGGMQWIHLRADGLAGAGLRTPTGAGRVARRGRMWGACSILRAPHVPGFRSRRLTFGLCGAGSTRQGVYA